MQNERINPDEAIDKTLAALRTAAPPEGMEARIDARIAHRLQQHAALAPVAQLRWFTGSTLAAAWGRGALSGAAAALLIVGALLLTQHGLRATQIQGRIAAVGSAATHNTPAAIAPVAASLDNASSRQTQARPCVSERVLQVRGTAPARASDAPRAEDLAAIYAPSHPAPALPLTAQERELVELARTASPKVLASLNSDAQAKSIEEDETEFNKFFAPPPEPPQPGDSESATKTNENQSQL